MKTISRVMAAPIDQGETVCVFSAQELAEAIGLEGCDLNLLGSEPVAIPLSTAERLRLYGADTELTSREIGLILRCSADRVWSYTTLGTVPRSGVGRVVLASRRACGRSIRVRAGDLADYVRAVNTLPIVAATRGELNPAKRTKQAQRKADEVRKKHSLT